VTFRVLTEFSQGVGDILLGAVAALSASMKMLPKPCGCPDAAGKRSSKQPEVDSDNAMKRFLVRTDVVTASNTSALPAPNLGYQSKLDRPNHKLFLRNDPRGYNYPSLINIFLPI
jgi:hypothetical protein